MRHGKVLMLAYVFPPFSSVGSCIRVVKFLKYLGGLGWQPSLLTISAERELVSQRRVGSEELLSDISPNVPIHRTRRSGEMTLSTFERHQGLRGKGKLTGAFFVLRAKLRNAMDRRLMIPDSKIRWLPYALKATRRLVRLERPDVLFVTCPPHSAAVIGAFAKSLTGLPLVIDYRDDWVDTPWFRSKSPLRQALERRLERWVIKRADRVIVVTRWSLRSFLSRYPQESGQKFVMIPNGCDLEDFRKVPYQGRTRGESEFWIVHTGVLPPWGAWKRNPEALLRAVTNLRKKSAEMKRDLKLIFTGHLEHPYPRMLSELGLQDCYWELGHLSRNDFVNLLRSANLLLAVNYDDFCTLIPGKIYEYWAAGSAPILLLGCEGAASDLLEENGIGTRVDPYNVGGIEGVIEDCFLHYKAGKPLRISNAGAEAYDRRGLAATLCEVLESLRKESPVGPRVVHAT